MATAQAFALPFTLGHENAGWVEKMGSGATGFAPGEAVIVYGPWGCGLCVNCRQGLENYCQDPGKRSAGGLGGADGGMAEYLLVPATRYLIPLGEGAIATLKDITRGLGAELVLDFVRVDATLGMAARIARVLGHLTIFGVGGAALPVNFHSPPHECSVAAPFWGSIPELIDVIALAQHGKIGTLVEHFPLTEAGRAYDLLHHGKIKGRAVITPND